MAPSSTRLATTERRRDFQLRQQQCEGEGARSKVQRPFARRPPVRAARHSRTFFAETPTVKSNLKTAGRLVCLKELPPRTRSSPSPTLPLFLLPPALSAAERKSRHSSLALFILPAIANKSSARAFNLCNLLNGHALPTRPPEHST